MVNRSVAVEVACAALRPVGALAARVFAPQPVGRMARVDGSRAGSMRGRLARPMRRAG